MITVSLPLQVFGSIAINRTAYVPGLLYNLGGGVDPVNVVPSPKSHSKISPARDILLKGALCGAQPVVGVRKRASTLGATLIVLEMVSG